MSVLEKWCCDHHDSLLPRGVRTFCAVTVALVMVDPTAAQAPRSLTVSRVVKYAQGTDKVRVQLAGIKAARPILAGDFAIGTEDLDDDGHKEIILRSRALPLCRQSPCPLLVLRQTPNGAETLFDQMVPPSDLAVTNEKVGGLRALVQVDRTGQITPGARGGGAASSGQQVYVMRGGSPEAQASTLSAATKAPPSARAGRGLVGRPITDQAGITKAFMEAIKCNANISDARPLRHEGTLRGQPFQFYAVECPFEGGNAVWAAALVAFHDGSRLTRAVGFAGGLNVASVTGVRNERLVYEADVTKPEDARCCPTGTAIVEVDPDKLVATTRAVGFSTRYDPVRGKVLK